MDDKRRFPKQDTLGLHLLDMAAVCGELPTDLLTRLSGSSSYTETVITSLKKDGLLKTYYKDKLRGYRLGQRAKRILLERQPERFSFYLTGNVETNRIKSEVPRRIRLHRVAETYVAMQNAGIAVFRDEKPLVFSPGGSPVARLDSPAFYSSREVKEMGIETVKIRGSRMTGVLLAPSGVFISYNGGSHMLKWDYRAEQRAQALLQMVVCHQRLSAQHASTCVSGLLFGNDLEPFYRIFADSDTESRCFFLLEGGRLPVPVHVLGEELTACGTIPDLSRRLSVIRSRNISMSCVFQNLAGLQNRYPLNLWQEILGNCDVQLFLGCTDPLTAEFVSSRTGLASVAVSSKSKQLGTWRISNYTPEYRETSGVGKRPVLTPDEVLRLPIDEALVIIRGKKTLKVDKMDYSKHPEYPLLRSCKASAHIPEWRRLEMEAAAAPEPAVKPAPQKTDAKQTSKAAVKPATKTGAKPAAKGTVKAPASGAQQKAPSPPASGSKKSAPSGTPAGIVSADKDSIMS